MISSWPTIYWGVYLLISKPIDFISFLGLFHWCQRLFYRFQSLEILMRFSSWPSINISTILKIFYLYLKDTYVVLYICQLVKVYNHVVDVVYVLPDFCLHTLGIQKISATWLQVTYQLLREMIISCLFLITLSELLFIYFMAYFRYIYTGEQTFYCYILYF